MQAPKLSVDDASVKLSQQEDCWTLSIARSQKANALTTLMMEELRVAVSRAGQQEKTPILLLCSESSRAFCAGADIAEFGAGPEYLARQEHALLAMIRAFSTTPAPIIAVARGRASGAGAMLLALADVVLAAEDLVISAPEMHFGMYPVIVEAVLQSRLSSALASQLCISGRNLNAKTACDLGLVTEVLPDADFDDRAHERVDFYLKRAVGLGIARRARITAGPVRQLLERLPQVAPLMGENYANEGVRARIADYLANLGASRRVGVDG